MKILDLGRKIGYIMGVKDLPYNSIFKLQSDGSVIVLKNVRIEESRLAAGTILGKGTVIHDEPMSEISDCEFAVIEFSDFIIIRGSYATKKKKT